MGLQQKPRKHYKKICRTKSLRQNLHQTNSLPTTSANTTNRRVQHPKPKRLQRGSKRKIERAYSHYERGAKKLKTPKKRELRNYFRGV